VRENERRRLERRYSRRDVSGERELFDAVLVQSGCHAGRHDDDDSIASCAENNTAIQSVNQSTKTTQCSVISHKQGLT